MDLKAEQMIIITIKIIYICLLIWSVEISYIRVRKARIGLLKHNIHMMLYKVGISSKFIKLSKYSTCITIAHCLHLINITSNQVSPVSQ